MADTLAIATLGVGAGPRALATAGFGGSGALRFSDPTDRPVAVQGVGYSTRLTALQGFDVRFRRPAPSRGGSLAPRRRRRDTDDDVLLFMLR